MTSDRQPAAQLLVPTLGIRMPLTAVPGASTGHHVTYLNGHPQIDLPIGIAPDGREVLLRVTDPEILSRLTYLSTLSQGRMGVAITGHAA